MIEQQNSTGEGAVFLDFDVSLGQVKRLVSQALSRAPSIVSRHIGYLREGQGKYIRAVSLLTCAMNGQTKIPENAVKLAAAMEILHLATLVHDDIIDDADLRRGIPTLKKKYGNKTAVICGDYLLGAALKLSASIDNRKDYLDTEMPEYLSSLSLGELEQHINNGNLNLSVYRYLHIISGKTAALFEACFHAGAVLCGADSGQRKAYRRLGHSIGMIFQMTDDCMDFEAGENAARKPVQSDYEQGVITLPLIRALKSSPEFKQKLQTRSISREEINRAVFTWGGLDFTRLTAGKYADKARKQITLLDINEFKRDKLQLILQKALRL
jgi:heptaprenyl diphosphate synthase